MLKKTTLANKFSRATTILWTEFSNMAHENMWHMLQYCEEKISLANTLNARFAPYYSEVMKNSICFGMNALTSMYILVTSRWYR
jgi:hypothetical protein